MEVRKEAGVLGLILNTKPNHKTFEKEQFLRT